MSFFTGNSAQSANTILLKKNYSESKKKKTQTQYKIQKLKFRELFNVITEAGVTLLESQICNAVPLGTHVAGWRSKPVVCREMKTKTKWNNDTITVLIDSWSILSAYWSNSRDIEQSFQHRKPNNNNNKRI